MGEFGFGQSIQKMYENYGKVLFYETYLEKNNINGKPLFWSQNKITTKFVQKKWVSFIFDKVYENYPKIKEKCYFMELTSKTVI